MKTAIVRGTGVALVCGLLVAWAWSMLLVPAVQAQDGGPGHVAPGAGAMASPHFAVQGALAGAPAGDAQSDNYAVRGEAVSDQGKVWQDVEGYIADFEAHSPTMAMRDTVEQKRHDFESYVNALPYPEGARGVMVAVSGRFVSMDVLDQPKMFERIWNRLVTGYAMDAARNRDQGNTPFTEKGAKFFLDSIPECTVSEFKAVGLGRELRFESNLLLGQALVIDNDLVHMSVFPNREHNRTAHNDRYHIMPPSFRRRPRRDM